MSRRSTRLMTGGYYNSEDESDSSSVTNISYREIPVKVFKKKAGTRKSGPRTPNRKNSDGSSVEAADISVTPVSDQSDTTMRTVPLTKATPRPALSHSSRMSESPTVPPMAPPEKVDSHFMPDPKLPGQTSVDSSGYSSSEGTYKKPNPPVVSTGSRPIDGASSPGYKRRMNAAFVLLVSFCLQRMSLVAAAVKSTWTRASAIAVNPSVRKNLKKFGGFCVLLIAAVLCLWFLVPLLTSFVSQTFPTKSPKTVTTPPVAPFMPAPPAPPPETIQPVALDPAAVSTAVGERMQQALETLQTKQEQLMLQLKQQLEADVQIMSAKLDAASTRGHLRLESDVVQLGQQMDRYQTAGRAATDGLVLRIQDLEAQNGKLLQELSVMRALPPPEPSASAGQNQVTPELQQAVEKWLTGRMKADGDPECCRLPRAHKMADFALESQGASVISTKCSETYRTGSACLTLFGLPLWYYYESPRTVIQGHAVLLPGKCWAFHGVQGSLVISLSHPIRITHVTLDHLPRYNSPADRIDSAPRDFEVYGMTDVKEEGTLLGTFTYDHEGESSQTFDLLFPSEKVFSLVELRVLSNWGQVEYTCLYRFRVHGKMASV